MKLSQLTILFQNSTSSAIVQESVSTEFEKIIYYLNKTTGHKFESSTMSYRLLWSKLNAKGYTLADAKLVIDFKIKDWSNWNKRQKKLHPNTLLDFANFKKYLNEAIINQAK